MNNFSYWNPTRILFGEGTIAQLKNRVPQGAKVLMTYGGGSIFKNGVYEQVKQAMLSFEMLEFGGIEANPSYETLMQAVEIVKRENVTFLLAVGGGSVLDGTKFIAAAARFEGSEPWDILSKDERVRSAIPLASVLTLPATGSEMNSGAVISRKSTQEKLSFASPFTFPLFSILDPKSTYSLPKKQIRNGIVDSFIHVTEQYLTYPVATPLQDRQAEAILKTLLDEADAILAEPKNYDAMATFMWCATSALNGFLGCGVVEDWATHIIGHEITAFYGLDHAETLAIVLPALLRYKKEVKAERLVQYGSRVFRLTGGQQEAALETSEANLEAAIAATEAFFHRIGMPTHFADYGISAAEAAQKVSERLAQRDVKIGERGDILAADIRQILLSAN
jgi:NADP-dependent alcohol dehydrogenase